MNLTKIYPVYYVSEVNVYATTHIVAEGKLCVCVCAFKLFSKFEMCCVLF